MIIPDGWIPTVTLDHVINNSNVKFIRWQVHDDWVGQVCAKLLINIVNLCKQFFCLVISLNGADVANLISRDFIMCNNAIS